MLTLFIDVNSEALIIFQPLGCTISKWPVEVTLRPLELILPLLKVIHLKKNLQNLNLLRHLKEKLRPFMFVLSYYYMKT